MSTIKVKERLTHLSLLHYRAARPGAVVTAHVSQAQDLRCTVYV